MRDPMRARKTAASTSSAPPTPTSTGQCLGSQSMAGFCRQPRSASASPCRRKSRSSGTGPAGDRIGAIRQMFPRDRVQQDLHFDEIATSHAPADASGGDTPTPPTPATDTKSK